MTYLDATVDNYNARSRAIEMKLEIYFKGLNNEPLVATKDNYLVNVDILEEASADTDKPFGAVSANELSFCLYSNSGMFNPLKKDSVYYGYIKSGVPIKAFIRPIEDDKEFTWTELGTFYVTDWYSDITGITANVTADDKMQAIFNKPQFKIPVVSNVTFNDAFKMFFNSAGEEVKVDESLTERLMFMFGDGDNKTVLNNLSIGAQAYTFCDRDGVPKVMYNRGPKEVAHTLTDADQVIQIAARQSAILEYDGAEVIANYPQESAIDTILSLKNVTMYPGDNVSNLLLFSKKPIVKVAAARLRGSADTSITDIKATSIDVMYTIHNSSVNTVEGTIDILGTFLENNRVTFSDSVDNILSVDNVYIQSDEYAFKVKRLLNAFVSTHVPILELHIRGNPMYKLGDKLHVISTKYGVDFYGVLMRQQFSYDGSLSSTITLINSEIMEVT